MTGAGSVQARVAFVDGPRFRQRHGVFAYSIAAIAALGLVARLAYALAVAPHHQMLGDAVVYHALGVGLAHGQGYSTLASLVSERPMPTAEHPPLYPLYLAGVTKLGFASMTAHRAASCLFGTLAVILTGLLGRRLAGPRAGVLAAAIAAGYPVLIMIDGTVLAESLYAPLVVGILILAYRVLEAPTRTHAAVLGLLIGLATLTRPEAILFLVALVVPVAWKAGGQRFVTIGVCFLATLLVLTPWLYRNWRVEDRFPLLSTNGSLTQLATNCDSTYYGRIGFVDHSCGLRSPCVRIADEARMADCARREATAYVRNHLTRLPVVVLYRVARVWDVVGYDTNLDYGGSWGRARTPAVLGLMMYLAMLPLAAFGVFVLRRTKVSVLPLLIPFLVVIVTAAVTFGFNRYRLAAEFPLVILAAVALDALLPERLSARAWRAPSRPEPPTPILDAAVHRRPLPSRTP